MVQGAVFDAVNAIGRNHHRPYLLKERFPAQASEDAAVAAAAYGVLHGIVSTVPNLPVTSRTTVLATLATQYADALAAIPDGWREAKGIAAGEAAAQAMIAAREDDGRFGPSQWVPNTAPGHWWPQTDPATGQHVLDPTPWVGGVKPFMLESGSQFRTRGPLKLSSAKCGKRIQRGEGDRRGEQHRPDANPDLHRTVVAEHAGQELERGRPRPRDAQRSGRGPTPPVCSRCRTSAGPTRR